MLLEVLAVEHRALVVGGQLHVVVAAHLVGHGHGSAQGHGQQQGLDEAQAHGQVEEPRQRQRHDGSPRVGREQPEQQQAQRHPPRQPCPHAAAGLQREPRKRYQQRQHGGVNDVVAKKRVQRPVNLLKAEALGGVAAGHVEHAQARAHGVESRKPPSIIRPAHYQQRAQ